MPRTNSLHSAFALDSGSFPQLPAIDSFVPSGQYLVSGLIPGARHKCDSLCPYGSQSPGVKHDNTECHSSWQEVEKHAWGVSSKCQT